jgi:Xaa-Pro aminopeptidase
MQEYGCEALLIQNPLDLLYLTDLVLSAGKLCIYGKSAMLFVDGRYVQAAKEHATVPVCLDEKGAAPAFFHSHGTRSLWFDGQHTTYDAFLKCQESFQDIDLISKPSFFKTLRLIKDESEIQKMKKSAHLLWKGFEYIRSQLITGIAEKELARRFEIFCLQNGGEGLAFEPIIAFGPHSAMPHYRSGNTALRSGDIVLIDIGVVVDRYHSDMTRVLFFEKADPELEKLHRINKAAHDAALQLCRPGVAVGALDRAARDVMAQHGVESLFVHSLGHGIGLETHEPPRIKWDGEDKDLLLASGMVITIEPGLYRSGKGGVRFEDTILITESGYENFYPENER